MWNRPKIIDARPVAALPPQAIIDNFVSDQQATAAYHRNEMERLQSIIDDATARLANHTRAYEALTDVLSTLAASEPLEPLTIAGLPLNNYTRGSFEEFEAERDRQKTLQPDYVPTVTRHAV